MESIALSKTDRKLSTLGMAKSKKYFHKKYQKVTKMMFGSCLNNYFAQYL